MQKEDQSSGAVDVVGRANGAANERLDGWKSIAAYFGRDRTTVIRWARERGLPVHRIPGGRTGTVYALRRELDRWAGTAAAEAIDPAEREVVMPETTILPSALAPGRTSRRFGRVTIAATAGAAMIAATAIAMVTPDRILRRPVASVPADPALAAQFLTARDLAADRSAAGLERAIDLLQKVLRQSPDFAPGQAALGEALILSREFGRRSDAEAFARARIAARSAVRLDPHLAAGHRLMGFIAYWRDGDFVDAKTRFERALAIDDDDPMTHFWFGNILSDHGHHAAALAELNRARLLQPGSVALRTDLAWARWMSGDEATATAELREIAARHPDFAVVHDCLSIIALIGGQADAYIDHFTAFATLRDDARLRRRADELARAQTAGSAALHQMVLHHALEDVASGERNRLWAVTITSLIGDRTKTVALLRDADARDERWGEAGLVDRVRAIWRQDLSMVKLIDQRNSLTIA